MSFFSFLFTKKFPSAAAREQLLSGPLTLLRALFYILLIALLALLYTGIVRLNDRLLITVPAPGGTFVEGIIGAPRYINPVLAVTETDIALSRLVYAGLMKEYGDGALAPELAASYTISPDDLIYTFTLRDDLSFHDHSALTSSDVAYTVEKLQDPTLNTRSASYWQDITVETPNEHTVIFTLPGADPSFLSYATVGIMPFEVWRGIEGDGFSSTELNLAPIGAGAFKVAKIAFDDRRTPKKITLSRFRQYALGAPLLRSLELAVYANQESLRAALRSGAIDFTVSLLPESLSAGVLSGSLTTMAVPGTTRVELFRHANASALANPSLLAIINRFVDKKSLVATVENGYGIPLGDPENTQEESAQTLSLDEAQQALAELGYTVRDGVLSKGGSPVALGIATKNDPKHIAIGRELSQQLAALGIIVDVQAFTPGTFADELASGTFALVLADSTTPLPDSYTTGIPLYTTAFIYAGTKNVHSALQEKLIHPTLRYATAHRWYERTDRIYPWIQKNIIRS